jgi:hypothetical protein
MPALPIICADVEARDLEAHYLAGRLQAADIEAYEAHYFGCDRCWRSLKRATEARAAFTLVRPRARWRSWGLASAATLVLAVGTSLFLSRDPLDREQGLATFRGATDSIAIRSSSESGVLEVSWGRVADAERYRVRLYRADGGVVAERETVDTTLALPLDSIDATARSGALYWQVQAFDRVRQPLVGSKLTPVTVAPPSAVPR